MIRNYLEPQSKKTIGPLSDRLQQKLANDLKSDHRDARPRTPFVNGLIKELRNQLEEQYQAFCEQQAQDHSLQTPEQFALLSQTELLVLLGDNYNTKDFDFEEETKLAKMT